MITYNVSITDIIQTCVGALTAFGLIYTLYLQAKYTKLTAGLLSVEQERDRRAVMPYFEVEQVYDKVNNIVEVGLRCKDNSMKLVFAKPKHDKYREIYQIMNFIKRDECIVLNFPAELTPFKNPDLFKTEDTHEINFFDKESRPYTQILTRVGYNFYTSGPIPFIAPNDKKTSSTLSKWMMSKFSKKKKSE